MTAFWEHLLYAMHERKKSAADVARMTGLSEANISRYLAGISQPSLKSAVVLADKLGVSLDWLSGNGETNTDFKEVYGYNAMVRTYVALSLSDKDKVLEYAELLLSKERKEDV